MAVFRFVINDAKESWQVEKDQSAAPVVGKKIGDTIDGNLLGLEGFVLKITGGTDKNGIPMVPYVEGPVRRNLVLTGDMVGFSGKQRGRKKKRKAKRIEGLRKRKIVRGDQITADVTQINCKVEKAGAKKLSEILPPRPAKEKKEVKAEEKK